MNDHGSPGTHTNLLLHIGIGPIQASDPAGNNDMLRGVYLPCTLHHLPAPYSGGSFVIHGNSRPVQRLQDVCIITQPSTVM